MSNAQMTRNGKALKILRDGHPRRLSDARNAWRKMTDEQRQQFVAWAGIHACMSDDKPCVAYSATPAGDQS